MAVLPVRRAYDETVALRHAVRSLPAPSAARAEAARARIYARLERSVRVVAPTTTRPAPLWGLRFAGGLATAGAAAGLLFLTLPGLRPASTAPAAPAGATPSCGRRSASGWRRDEPVVPAP